MTTDKLLWAVIPAAFFLTGCGSVQQVVMKTVRESAEEALKEAIDAAVQDAADQLLDELPFDEMIEDVELEDDAERPAGSK